MSKKILSIILVIISLITIIVDCYAGYVLFLMTAMPIGFYLSPFLLLFIVVTIPIIFIASLVGLFKFRKWGYRIFFIITVFLHSFLVVIYIDYLHLKAIKPLELQYVFPMVYLLIFIIYFLLPPVRRLFK
jgi:hypothetical protein